MLYIGIDLGTSAVKLLLMNEVGEIKNIISKEYPINFPKNGWSEQNPEDWYIQTISGIKELIKYFDKSQINGISFGGQMHGLVVLDKNDEVIRPAILWNDSRTTKETQYLNNVVGKEKLSKHTANIAFTGFTAPKILWMKENEPDNFNKISKIMLPKDYIAYKMSGIFCTDISDASGTLLYDVKNNCWSKTMIDICGIKETQLPKLFKSYEVVGNINIELAEQLGINEEVKIIAGAGDNAAAAIGTATVGDGMCNISIGTSGTIFISSEKFKLDENNALHSFAHSDGNYHLMGCILSAASCTKWWIEGILQKEDYDNELKFISNLGENKVFFLPYLMGERSPHNDPNSRGCFIGMSTDTTKQEMSQSVLEGVAFALRDNLEIAKKLGIKIENTKICGGGAKSLLWVNIISNILNLKVEKVESEEGPALGAAILAAVGCKEFKNVEDATKKIIKIKETIYPDPITVEKYNIAYSKFKKIYPSIKNLYTELI